MARKKFNSELAVSLRKKMGMTQNQFFEHIQDELTREKDEQAQANNHSKDKSKDHPKEIRSKLPDAFSLRTLRELESGTPIEEEKGVYVFKILGREPSKEIYSESEDVPEFLPYTGSGRDKEILHEVALDDQSHLPLIWDKIEGSTHYYLHIGQLNEEQYAILPSLAEWISRRGKVNPEGKINSDQNWLSRKIEDRQLLKAVKNLKMKIFLRIEIEKFTIFEDYYLEPKDEHEKENWRHLTYLYEEVKYKMWDRETLLNPDDRDSYRDYTKVLVDGPERIAVIGITSTEDKSLRKYENEIILIIQSSFSPSDIFPFKKTNIAFLDWAENDFQRHDWNDYDIEGFSITYEDFKYLSKEGSPIIVRYKNKSGELKFFNINTQKTYSSNRHNDSFIDSERLITECKDKDDEDS